MMKVMELARQYIRRGWSPVPIPHGDKGPTIQEWGRLVITEDNVGEYFNKSAQNIGVQLGPKSNGLTDIDLDCVEAVTLAPHYLPKTDAVFGRRSKPRSHYLYYCRDAVAKAAVKLQDETGGSIIELRLGAGGKAAQTVFPGSQHPSGEPVEWASEGEPANATYALLKGAIDKVAIGVLLMRNWPRSGRHDCALRVGGLLARAGWTPEDASDLVRTVADRVGDEEAEDRGRAAQDTVEAHARGEAVYGLPALTEVLSETIAKRIAALLSYKEDDHDELLERMNGRFCVLAVGSSARILEMQVDRGRQLPVFYKAGDFKMLFDNAKVQSGNKRIGQATWWLSHSSRRQYEGVTFRPGEAKVVSGRLNFWENWGVEPTKGKWPLLHKHIHEVLANGDAKCAEYITRWTAWSLQNPGQRPEVALVFRGGRGVGKGVFARALCKAFGQHGLQVSSFGQFGGRFNAHLMTCAMLFADEAYWPGNKSAEGTLKSMITEPWIQIEKKGVDLIQVDNALHIIMAANDQWVVPAGSDERRFGVFDVSDQYKQAKKYFIPLYAEIEGDGLAAMMYDLLNLDLKGWHPRYDVPNTAALRDQISLSLPPLDQWWSGLLQEGTLPGAQTRNPRRASSKDLFEHARQTVPKLKFSSDHELGHELTRRGCRRVEVHGSRGWEFPPLSEARKECAGMHKKEWDQPDVVEWTVPSM